MSSPQQAAKRRGATFETDLVKYIRSLGYPTERLRLNGTADEGDVVVEDAGFRYILEAKAEKSMDLSGYVREAEREVANYVRARGIDPGNAWGLAVVKRRGRPIGESYVITTLDALLG